MRVAVVTESFLPQVNGVTNSVQRVLEHLERRGHDALVVAPAAAGPGGTGPREYAGAPVLRAPSMPIPGYRSVRVAGPWASMSAVLRAYAPDVVHLAAPAVLGAQAAFTANRMGLPSVAIFQTDLAGFAGRYGLPATERQIWRWLARVHRVVGRTLAPSRASVEALVREGVGQIARWARGVDLERFHPAHRDPGLHTRLAPSGELVVGYVGRLAREKRVHLLGALSGLAGVRVVVVGDGPLRRQLERRLPEVEFLGFLGGQQLAAAMATFDVFVHTGADETFCQAAQEAQASGVPVVAPAAGGLLDVVEHGVTGLHYPPDGLGQLRRSVAMLTADQPLRAAMGARARASVIGNGWPVLGDELLGHYRDVVAGVPVGPVGQLPPVARVAPAA